MMAEKIEPKLQLKQALVKENMNGLNLATLEPDFYKTIREWILTLSGEDRTAIDTIYNQLVFKRKSKIVTLAHALNHDPDIRAKLTTEEREYFDAVANATVKFQKGVIL